MGPKLSKHDTGKEEVSNEPSGHIGVCCGDPTSQTNQDNSEIESVDSCIESEDDTFEVQYLGPGPEFDESASCWAACTKYPGHVDFIPIKDFSMDHIPKPFRRLDAFDAIMKDIDLTVRIRGNYVSHNRLPHWPKSSVGIAPHVGTGYVYAVEEIFAGEGNCNCYKFQTTMLPKENHGTNKLWMIQIITAAHALFDDEEPQYASVDFFYDDEESRHDGRLVSIGVLHVHQVWPDDGWCMIHCVTDNEALFTRLLQLQCRTRVSAKSGNKKTIVDDRCAVIVSHPHGQPKRISVGHPVPLPGGGDSSSQILGYSTPTCPGSSGAAVVFLWPTAGYYPRYGSRIHSRSLDCGANASGGGMPLMSY